MRISLGCRSKKDIRKGLGRADVTKSKQLNNHGYPESYELEKLHVLAGLSGGCLPSGAAYVEVSPLTLMQHNESPKQ